MSVKNYYPQLPILKYLKVAVEMGAIVAEIKSYNVLTEVKRAAYIVIRNESGNGSKFVNNNGIGLQSDCGLWPAEFNRYFSGVTYQHENLTGNERGFLCFKQWQNSIAILLDEINTKGLYIGGHTHSEFSNQDVTDADAMCLCYERLWVYGDKDYKPTKIELYDFNSMYNQAKKIFV